MADFYNVPVRFLSGRESAGRGVGNNAAWICECGEILLGPHEGMYQIDPCPSCARTYRIHRGEAPEFVDRVEET